ncbi:MAG: hypothetical protein U5J64_01825 [Halobacteriales archaeon]|nr:hypothetical protein [Halobacteriales archaeon]
MEEDGNEKTKKEDGEEEDESDGASWYDLPPAAFFFTAGVLAAFLPKDALFAGDYTDPTAVLLVLSNVVIFVVFFAFVAVVRRIGFTPAVQWMVSPGFAIEK